MQCSRFVLLVVLGILTSAAAQDSGVPKAANEIQATRSTLIEENEFFRIHRVELSPGAGYKIDQHDRDVILVALDDGFTVSANRGNAEALPQAGAYFSSVKSVVSITNSATKPSQLLIVELKRHWEVEVKPCAEPSRCTRPIRMGEASIGETTTLFSNGFVSAQRHRLDAGGTLASSYFSAKGKDHLLLVALTDLHANLDGLEQELKRGQTFASEATAIEVDAPKVESTWIVLRMNIPKE